jgi:hypothetical protein
MNSSQKPLVIINPVCNNERIIEDLSKAYHDINNVPFEDNIINYFSNMYRELKESNIEIDFLKDSECISIYYLFQKLLQKPNGNFDKNLGVSKTAFLQAYNGYVYQIETFSLFAKYHYLTIVFGGGYVDIYQSYGSTFPLNQTRIDIKEFKKCIEILDRIKNRGRNFDSDLIDMIYVEKTLYNVDLEKYFTILLNHHQNLDAIDMEEDEIKDGIKTINKILEEYPELLDIFNNVDQLTVIDYFSGLKMTYEDSINPPLLIIDEYRPKLQRPNYKRKLESELPRPSKKQRTRRGGKKRKTSKLRRKNKKYSRCRK